MEKSIETDKKLQKVLTNEIFINFIITNSSLAAFLNVCERFSINPQIIKTISEGCLVSEVVIEEYKRFMKQSAFTQKIQAGFPQCQKLVD